MTGSLSTLLAALPCALAAEEPERMDGVAASHIHVTTLDGLQLLCRPSHREKTTRDGTGPP